MIGVLFIGSCDAYTGCLLMTEVELHEEHIWEVEPSACVLEGKCTQGPLLPMNYYHSYSCMCLIWNTFKDFT